MVVDVDLDSPLLPLGALWLAGSSRRGRRFTGGEGGTNLLAAGFAGASAEWATDQALGALNLDNTIANPLGQVALGAALSRWGGRVPMNRTMARGIHYNVAINAMSDLGADAGSLFGDLVGGGGGNTGNLAETTSVSSTSPSVSQASRTQGVQTTRTKNTMRF